LCEYSHKKSESLAQIHTTMTERQHFFYGIVFYWRTLLLRTWMHKFRYRTVNTIRMTSSHANCILVQNTT